MVMRKMENATGTSTGVLFFAKAPAASAGGPRGTVLFVFCFRVFDLLSQISSTVSPPAIINSVNHRRPYAV